MAVAKLFPYKAGQRVLWRGKIGTEAKVSTFRPYKVGQRVRLRGKDCDGKIVEGRIYKGGQRALARAAYKDCDLPPGDPGTCLGCNYAVVRSTMSVIISGFQSDAAAYPGTPCCSCLAQWERINGTYALSNSSPGSCGWSRTSDSNLRLYVNCAGCLAHYVQVGFSLSAVPFGTDYYWYFYLACASIGIGGQTRFTSYYRGPKNTCGSFLSPAGIYTYEASYRDLVVYDPALSPCLANYPAAVQIN